MQTDDRDPWLDTLLTIVVILIVVVGSGLLFLLADILNQHFHWWVPSW